ncbi:MAG: hypothetical protein EZS28_013835 [Streblomastix strix]|uniref:SPRY domain-containing protein n=1 Tax=Streblomastix strix TaxID=222440 RepID=A0A5J4W785_9EUKA|nr:MAG: hypothetical protein EZS28_013835 [Streblomastix strix]
MKQYTQATIPFEPDIDTGIVKATFSFDNVHPVKGNQFAWGVGLIDSCFQIPKSYCPGNDKYSIIYWGNNGEVQQNKRKFKGNDLFAKAQTIELVVKMDNDEEIEEEFEGDEDHEINPDNQNKGKLHDANVQELQKKDEKSKVQNLIKNTNDDEKMKKKPLIQSQIKKQRKTSKAELNEFGFFEYPSNVIFLSSRVVPSRSLLFYVDGVEQPIIFCGLPSSVRLYVELGFIVYLPFDELDIVHIEGQTLEE